MREPFGLEVTRPLRRVAAKGEGATRRLLFRFQSTWLTMLSTRLTRDEKRPSGSTALGLVASGGCQDRIVLLHVVGFEAPPDDVGDRRGGVVHPQHVYGTTGPRAVLDDVEVAELLYSADAFVFPYRRVDASGVFFLTCSLGKWIIASRVGVFSESLVQGENGYLISPGDPVELAAALLNSIGQIPNIDFDITSWEEIGSITRGIYANVVDLRRMQD